MRRFLQVIPVLLLGYVVTAGSFESGMVAAARESGRRARERGAAVPFGQRAEERAGGRIIQLPVPGDVEASDPTFGIDLAPPQESKLHERQLTGGDASLPGGVYAKEANRGQVGKPLSAVTGEPASMAMLAVGIWLLGRRVSMGREMEIVSH